ncbi:MAG: hypothetical protein B6241_07785 [Spirochaetaceae bacterium 4572_59]|nr:MAG: hypothetical protein B6241_07785 [Spirochaetaceae bacterium 4572_59]
MKIVLPVWNSRVAPVFDAADQWVMVTVENDQWLIGGENCFSLSLPEAKARELLDQKMEYLICGAIPYRIERFLLEAGCGVRSFVSGEPEELIRAWINKTLDEPRYSMPGCGRQGYGRRGRDQGGSGRGGHGYGRGNGRFL